jgi:predicted RNA-binding Zn-ribbon protein involved in translation (DUF1610 family)
MYALRFIAFCPSCGYTIQDVEFLLAAYNYPCPRCANFKIREFTTVRKRSKE